MGSDIILIEDGLVQSDEVYSALQQEGYFLGKATDMVKGLEVIYKEKPQMVIIMTGLPFPSYQNEFIKFREISNMAILVVSAMDDIVELLESGADAFLPAPVSEVELVARVNSLMRRTGCRVSGVSP